MAGASLLTLLDDIATLLDDISIMTKVAVKKTAGVLGDDLALNAYQVSGITANRELPVVWAVAKGSLVNKAILVPAALLISFIAPWAVQPLLMIGGIYLCFEGVEKLVHRWLHRDEEIERDQRVEAIANPKVDMVAFEKERIRGAVRTDFVLSAEIIVISLGAVALRPFATRIGVLLAISMIMTVGVYGLVALIVKLDDTGIFLVETPGTTLSAKVWRSVGRFLLKLAPWLLKFLSFAGTAAMFLVGGSIIAHGIPAVHDFIHHLAEPVAGVAGFGWLFHAMVMMLLELALGLLAGAVAVAVFAGGKSIFANRSAAEAH